MRNFSTGFLLSILIAFGLSGCAPLSYQVQVNGYLDAVMPATLTPGANLFVIENKEAMNPLLEKEIKSKIEKLLEKQGYRISSFEKAEYYLLFCYGLGPGRNVTVIIPDYYPYGLGYFPGYSYGRPYSFVSPFISYSPFTETIYDRWLLLNVIDGKHYRGNGEFRTLWVGEARSTGTSADLRVAVNYLLLAALEQFGKNTGKAVTVEINEQDLRLKELEK